MFENYKEIIGVVATILTFVGFFPYIKDIFLRKTKPHLFSWFTWFFATFIIFILQYQNGGGFGSIVTLAVSISCLAITILSFKYGTKDVKKVDYIFIFVSLISLVLWLYFKQPIVSIILLVAVDLFAFLPTFRKSWIDPFSETLSMYVITTFRHALAIFALQEINLITSLFSVVWIFGNGLCAAMLFYRRGVLEKVK
jgi:hypothetical protein